MSASRFLNGAGAGVNNKTPGVSIVVINYNNGRFLHAAINSALGQTHSPCEVIVVDDCSTDNSRSVIVSFGDHIRIVLRKENGGQTEALNSAWPLARHPILIFLDSDDLLLPHAAATVAAHWTAGVTKIQFPLVTIDAAGRGSGHLTPRYLPGLDTATIRTELLRTGGSPNSPASGNAYSRALLDAVTHDHGFDLENSRQHWMDAILECNAPFYGEVVTLYDPLACYRLHRDNLYAITVVDTTHIVKLLEYFTNKLEYFAERCRTWGIPFDPTLASNHSLWYLECRLMILKLTCYRKRSADGWAREPILRILYRALRACINSPLPIFDRILRAGWIICIVGSTKPIAKRLIAVRFVAGERPAWLKRLLH
jgi:glycosyltransferase involved in cell wall biosynthesis